MQIKHSGIFISGQSKARTCSSLPTVGTQISMGFLLPPASAEYCLESVHVLAHVKVYTFRLCHDNLYTQQK